MKSTVNLLDVVALTFEPANSHAPPVLEVA